MNAGDPNMPGSDNSAAAPTRGPVQAAGSATPPPPPPGYIPVPYPAPPPRGGGVFTRILASIVTTVLVVSLLLNLYLGFIVASMTAGKSQVYAEGDATKRIVILPVMGLIDDDMFIFIRESLKELRDDPPAAIIFRVDSGGGYVGASDRIWHAIEQFKSDTNGSVPIIASFSSTAASGAYYISVTADHIVIEPTGITGSIGVIAQSFTVDQLMNKVGVTPETITSTDSTRKGELNPLRPWTEEDREVLREVLDSAYEQFVSVVVKGREGTLTEMQVRRLATGQIFTADEALDEKLVDSIGYLDDAIGVAKARAGMATSDRPHVIVMTKREPFGLGSLLGVSGPDMGDLGAQQVRDWMAEFSAPRLEYRWQLR